MTGTYKLTYFNGRGVAESIRYLFKFGNIKFEDVRLEQEDWNKIKDETLFGQLPILEYNGKTINQSLAICRYLAKLVKLTGNNDWENLEIDAIAETVNDMRLKINKIRWERDLNKKKILIQELSLHTIPFGLKRLESMAAKNNGYLAIKRLTWTDFYFVALRMGFEMLMGIHVFDKYPTLKRLIQTVENIPTIKTWIEERPKTEL